MPWYGSRQMARHLRRQGWCVGRKRVRRLMRKIGLSPIYQTPKTSEPRRRACSRPDYDVTGVPFGCKTRVPIPCSLTTECLHPGVDATSVG
jgi:hypothetical protein